MGPSSSRYNRAVMQRQFYSDSGLTKPTSVFPHHCDCLHPGRMQSTISQVLHQQLWVSFTQPPPSSFYKPFTKGTTTILVLPSPQKAVRSQPCYDSRSSCKQTWVQMTKPQLPLSSTVGKMKVHKVAQLPCHNLGRAGIAAEVVCAAPQREGVPAITHQEVPNQLRRDADRLWCTFLFFFFLLLLKSSKENAGPQHQWTRTSFPNSYEGNYTRKQKKLSPWTVCESLSLARAHPTVLVHRWLQSYQIWVKLVKQNHFPRTKWHSTVNSSFL